MLVENGGAGKSLFRLLCSIEYQREHTFISAPCYRSTASASRSLKSILPPRSEGARQKSVFDFQDASFREVRGGTKWPPGPPHLSGSREQAMCNCSGIDVGGKLLTVEQVPVDRSKSCPDFVPLPPISSIVHRCEILMGMSNTLSDPATFAVTGQQCSFCPAVCCSQGHLRFSAFPSDPLEIDQVAVTRIFSSIQPARESIAGRL